MKILQVFDFFSPLHGGGTVDVIYKLSKGLAQRGHEVAICTSDFELNQEYIDSLKDVEVFPFHNVFGFSGIYFTPHMAKFDITDFDAIHFHCYRSFNNAVLCSKSREYGIPYIIDAHGSTVKLSGFKQLLKVCYDHAFGFRDLKGASKVVAETQVGVREYRQLGVPLDKIAVIHPPIDVGEFVHLPEFGLFRNRYELDGKKVVLFLGKLHKIKGLEFLVQSFYELTKVKQDIVLVIAGSDCGYKSHLVKLIKKLHISDKVLFTGFLSGKDKLSALVDADVLVQPSIHEQGVRPAFEAILCNVPVIVTRETGAGEEIAKIDAGLLVRYGNKYELCDAMDYILLHPYETQCRTLKAKEYIKANLSLEKQVEKYEQLYQEVIK